jgi:hypothetical protein
MLDPQKVIENQKQVWLGNWRTRHLQRVRDAGSPTVAEFLNRYPAIPYHKVTRRHLGDVVAPIQLIQLQFDEAVANGTVREAAKDLLVRTINEQLKYGWQKGGHWRFNQAGVYSHFTNDLGTHSGDETLKEIGKRVIAALRQLSPAADWIPKSNDDPLIVQAFDLGWPEVGEVGAIAMP